MELRVQLEQTADVEFIKKLLSQLKGVGEVQLCEDELLTEAENDALVDQLLEQSLHEVAEGKVTLYSPEMLKNLFK
ncbi:MAG: hypothetical protein EAS48_09540 [Chryseobacterium sp.]|nr:MAG: hypothetical protein EAS48_09540 [Chryseobacterium sp.]